MNPLYYVTFTTCTLAATFILFGGFNTTDAVNTISLLCGFLVIFTGVYLLNLSRDDPDGHKYMLAGEGNKYEVDGIPTDGMAMPLTRRSMTIRRSIDGHRRSGSLGMTPISPSARRSQEDLMRGYDVERGHDQFGLTDLTEDSDEDSGGSGKKRTSYDRNQANGRSKGNHGPSRSMTIEFDDGKTLANHDEEVLR